MTTEPPPPKEQQGKLRVLLVEDDADTLATTLRLLEAMGHWATGVRSAEAAIARFFDGAFDLVMVDIGLPALSGRDFAERLLRDHRVPVVFVTGQAEPADGDAGHRVAAQAVHGRAARRGAGALAGAGRAVERRHITGVQDPEEARTCREAVLNSPASDVFFFFLLFFLVFFHGSLTASGRSALGVDQALGLLSIAEKRAVAQGEPRLEDFADRNGFAAAKTPYDGCVRETTPVAV
jgi:CheY-like chemotaxis protein